MSEHTPETTDQTAASASDPAVEQPATAQQKSKNDRIVWIDCEMTGLDPDHDVLVEIAALVTDSELNVLGEGIDIVINASDQALDNMAPVVQEMHSTSGLTEEIRRSSVTVEQAEQQVLDYLRAWVPVAGSAPLAGNSIGTDKAFLAKYMPKLTGHLHYRMIDVSSIKELCRRWYPRIYFGQPEKGMSHRALADIKESIRELQYYRLTAFVPLPGPSTDDVRAAAATLPPVN